MSNLTISLDDTIIRKARIRACLINSSSKEIVRLDMGRLPVEFAWSVAPINTISRNYVKS